MAPPTSPGRRPSPYARRRGDGPAAGRPRFSPAAPGRVPVERPAGGREPASPAVVGRVAVPARRLPAPRHTTYGGRPSWIGPLAVLLLLVGVFATGAGLGRSGGLTWPTWLGGESREPPREFPVMDPSRPVRLSIPSIKVEAPVHRVGLADDGSIAVPALEKHNETGWFDRGPTPGQFGSSIIVGHADTRTGPSVFHDLGKLRPGARIEVVRQDRSVAIFEVNSVEHFDKTALPAERVYGDFSRPVLRLITCGGQWLGGGVGYSDNVIAFASLVDARDP